MTAPDVKLIPDGDDTLVFRGKELVFIVTAADRQAWSKIHSF